MVILRIHDPILTLLFRHVTTLIQGVKPTIEIVLRSRTTRVVINGTDYNITRVVLKGMNQVPGMVLFIPPGDLDQVNLSSLAVVTKTRHVTIDINQIEIKDHQKE